MKRRKSNAGFTLVELVVSLAVSAIIAVMISIVFVNVNNVFNNKNYSMQKFNEFENVKKQITQLCDDFFFQGYDANIVENGHLLEFRQGQKIIEIKLEENKLKQNQTNIQEFETINSCIFEKIENVIVVKVEFKNQTFLRFVM